VSAEKKNKALVRRFLEEVSKGNLNVIDELLAPDFVDRSLLPDKVRPARTSSSEAFITRRNRIGWVVVLREHRFRSPGSLCSVLSALR
jgi:ketosteroid isomerase-like protein